MSDHQKLVKQLENHVEALEKALLDDRDKFNVILSIPKSLNVLSVCLEKLLEVRGPRNGDFRMIQIRTEEFREKFMAFFGTLETDQGARLREGQRLLRGLKYCIGAQRVRRAIDVESTIAELRLETEQIMELTSEINKFGGSQVSTVNPADVVLMEKELAELKLFDEKIRLAYKQIEDHVRHCYYGHQLEDLEEQERMIRVTTNKIFQKEERQWRDLSAACLVNVHQGMKEKIAKFVDESVRHMSQQLSNSLMKIGK